MDGKLTFHQRDVNPDVTFFARLAGGDFGAASGDALASAMMLESTAVDQLGASA